MHSTDHFPFRRWGLRGNPFQALTREEWAEVAILPSKVEATIQRNPRAKALQILGEAGAGKTSTLLALKMEAQYAGRPCTYEYIPPGSRRFRTPLEGSGLVLLDEAQRLRPPVLRALFRWLRQIDAPGLHLAWSSHQDLTPAARLAGIEVFSVTLDALPQSDLRRLLDRRLQFFALPEGSGLHFDPSVVVFLGQQFGGDLGGMEAFLYEYFQRGLVTSTIRREALADFLARLSAMQGR